MARENQGLQIALIIFVMLTIVLGVTTFLFFRQFEEAEIKTKASQEEAKAKATDASSSKAENAELKRLIGVGATESLEKVHEAFGQDMTTYAGTFPEENRFYRPVVKFLAKTVDTRNAELAAAKEEVQKLKNAYEVRESIKDPQIKEHQDAAAKAMKDKDAVAANFNSRREAVLSEQKELADQLKRAREEGKAALARVESKLEDTNTRLQSLAGQNRKLTSKFRDLTNDRVDVPEGEIRWVNQRNGTVWINLGRADSLGRQTNFAVYPAEITNTAKATKKASIEVTQILGDHLAEARVVDDQIADPIMPGDKIHTPVWNPGDQKRFALAGFLDVNHDGKSDQQMVCDLITSNGGLVDCQPGPPGSGKRVGEMTVLTRYLVMGDPPNEKGRPEDMQVWTKTLQDAERLGIQRVTLSDLLQRMGWKSETKVTRFGRGANPDDFKAKPDDGVPKKSTGNVFKPRQPPPVKSHSAY